MEQFDEIELRNVDFIRSKKPENWGQLAAILHHIEYSGREQISYVLSDSDSYDNEGKLFEIETAYANQDYARSALLGLRQIERRCVLQGERYDEVDIEARVREAYRVGQVIEAFVNAAQDCVGALMDDPDLSISQVMSATAEKLLETIVEEQVFDRCVLDHLAHVLPSQRLARFLPTTEEWGQIFDMNVQPCPPSVPTTVVEKAMPTVRQALKIVNGC